MANVTAPQQERSLTQALDHAIPVARQRPASMYLIGAAALSFPLWALVWLRPEAMVYYFGSWPLILNCLLLAFVLPPRSAALCALTLFLIVPGLDAVNDIKISLTTMPLTWADFRVFLSRPDASLQALMLPPSLHHGLLIGVPALLCAGLAGYIYALASARDTLLRLLAIIVIGLNGLLLVQHFEAATQRFMATIKFRGWEPKGNAFVSRQIGVPAFLVYSRSLDSQYTGAYFSAGKAEAPAQGNIDKALDEAIIAQPAHQSQRPNIVAVLAESTFDPNQVFRLQKPVRDYFFEDNALTHARGTLHVTPVGGGTWMSEFELFTGLNSRLFGFHGLYTHTMLAPYVKRSIVTDLRNQGYATAAYYATDGDFFNARAAFRHYGFETDRDAKDLGLASKGWHVSDRQIMNSVLRASQSDRTDKPFFKFIQLLENHAPHPCIGYKTDADLKVRLAGKASFAHNCRLNVYMDRLRSTGKAIQALVAHLKEEEKRTGRPFLIIAFGDHQPHTFTGTDKATLDFRAFRKNPDPRFAAFHIMGTAKKRLRWNRQDIAPLALLPTFLSLYTAKDRKDVFQPVNLYARSQCGMDMLGQGAEAMNLNVVKTPNRLKPGKGRTCPVLDSIVSSYKASGILALR